MNKDEALHYINSHNLIEIKAGKHRTTFLEIWMVTVHDRIFARSWGLAERSWYNTFLEDSDGQIKCGEKIVNIKAVVPDDAVELASEINTAYLTKYNTGENIKYSKGIIQQKHVEKTMELIICE
ncbi:hypothetical protein ACM46_16335 [Chryseobacterium angstadtii]|uniref:DUF2255 domain-containing protein n=1 Tax=Chryseobacterium angstadtii TaxID=558151 RepID=A0A0J7KWY8_9FLAO|nr:DUF2255 family protein [Chryseobacterium angstadtii]KMQ61570.1 hypothetical protein ACM46_16335 [Chryseobacterium angstadtii]